MDGAVCFANMEGALVHGLAEQGRWGSIGEEPDEQGLYAYLDKAGNKHQLIKMPVSLTYSEGVISVATFQKLAKVRSAGIPVAIITGARAVTLLQRLPFLPLADAYVCENGGRIFYRKPALPSAFGLVEDMAWRRSHDIVVGPHQQESRRPEERTGLLWDFYRELLKSGWKIDAKGFSTCIRIESPPEGQVVRDIDKLCRSHPELAHSDNVDTTNVYPAGSGKANAAVHVMHHFRASPKFSVFVCDDDDDIPLANLLGKAFLPAVQQDSMQMCVGENPEHFEVVRGVGGTLATERALDAVLEHYEIYSDSDEEEEEDSVSGGDRASGV